MPVTPEGPSPEGDVYSTCVLAAQRTPHHFQLRRFTKRKALDHPQRAATL